MLARYSVVLLAFVLSSCTWQAAEQSRPAGQLASEARYRTVVTVGQCVTSARGESFVSAALLSSLIASTVNRGLDRFGKALEEAGDPRISKVLATRNMEFSNSTLRPGICVQVSRGWMLPSVEGQVTGKLPVAKWADGHKIIPFGIASRMRNSTGTRFAARPDFFFEGLITRSGDDTMAMVTPVYAWLDRPITTEFLNSTSKRFATVSLAFQLADGSAPSVTKNGGGTILDLGRLSAGEGKCFEVLPTLIAPEAARDELQELLGALGFPAESQGAFCPHGGEANAVADDGGLKPIPEGGTLPKANGNATGEAASNDAGRGGTEGDGDRWQDNGAGKKTTALSKEDRESLRSIIVAHTPEQSEFFAFAVSDESRPYTVRALVTETREANAALQFLAGVFSDVKQTAGEAIVSGIDPAKRAEARATAKDDADTARNTADGALVEAINAVAACIEEAKKKEPNAREVRKKAFEARKKLRALNNAYRDAGAREPIPDSAISAIPLGGEGIERGCDEAKVKLDKVSLLGAGAVQ